MPTEKSTNGKHNEEVPADLGAEIAELGRKLSKAVNAAWTSEERRKLQREIEAGLVRLRDELNAAAKNVRESETGQKVEAEVSRVREDVETRKVVDEVRKGLVIGLRSAGDALDRLADSFTAVEEAPKKPKK